MAIIEAQDKMCLFVADVLERVSVPLRKVPDVPRLKNVRGRLPIGSDYGCEYRTLDYHCPLRGNCVPMQFSNAPWLQPHGNSSDILCGRELCDRSLLCRPGFSNPTLGSFDTDSPI